MAGIRGRGKDGAVSAPDVGGVVFVNETLFSLDRLRPAFTDAGLDPNWYRFGSPGCSATGSR
jgi:hypothetical protein